MGSTTLAVSKVTHDTTTTSLALAEDWHAWTLAEVIRPAMTCIFLKIIYCEFLLCDFCKFCHISLHIVGSCSKATELGSMIEWTKPVNVYIMETTSYSVVV